MRELLVLVAVLLVTTTSFSQTKVKTEGQLQTSISVKKAVQPKNQEEFLNSKKEKYTKYTSSKFRTENSIPSSFPKYVNTGNIKDDTALYEKSLKLWIEENKEEYKKIESALR